MLIVRPQTWRSMMRGFVPMLVWLVWIASSARADDAAADLKAVQGTWQLAELVTDAGPVPADRIKGVKLTIKDNKLTMDGLDGKRAFAIKLDPSRKPKAIDLTPIDGPFKGKTTLGLYSIDRDALKLCMGNQQVKARPAEFKPGGEGDLMVFTLKRIK